MSGQSNANMPGTGSTNRYSMPVTRTGSRFNIADLNLDSSLDGNNTTGFLFGDEDTANGESRAYQQANNADNFPTLVRNAGYPNMVSFASVFLGCVEPWFQEGTAKGLLFVQGLLPS